MQRPEFDKLFTKDNENAMIANLASKRELSNKSKQEKRDIIQERQQVIAPEFNERVQAFINKKKLEGKHINQIKSMVKSHFGITVV